MAKYKKKCSNWLFNNNYAIGNHGKLANVWDLDQINLFLLKRIWINNIMWVAIH